MTIRECYAMMDGDYDGVFSRLRKEERIVKFLGMFLRDPSYGSIKDAVAANDRETAFRAAHTIKRMCQNLSFTTLEKSAAALTEILRGGDLKGAEQYLPAVTADYGRTVEAIKEYEKSITG